MISRRRALKYLVTLAGMAGIASQRTIGQAAEITAAKHKLSAPGKSFRIAHITDVHINEKLDAAQWFAKCLQHIHNQEDKPALIVNTGDSVMDTLKTDKAAARAQWELFNKTLDTHCTIPIKHCIGNHDVWGWGLDLDSPAREDAEFGITYGVKNLKMEKPYYSFEQNGWHIIILNSCQPLGGPGYTAHLDEEQFQWLKADLKKTDAQTPVMIFSHIPIIAVSIMLNAPQDEAKSLMLRHSIMHTDFKRLVKLFSQHPNVKGCHSGHIHLLDEIELKNVKYCCNGAVSGAWWKGSRDDVPPGYTLIDLFEDGSFTRTYVEYGWEPTAVGLKS